MTGTLAVDYAADYGGRFSGLPRHPGVNLSIQLDRIERRFGGCAMNIAYGLRRLGQDALPFVFVGDDYGEDYRRHLERTGMDHATARCRVFIACIRLHRCRRQSIHGIFSGPGQSG